MKACRPRLVYDKLEGGGNWIGKKNGQKVPRNQASRNFPIFHAGTPLAHSLAVLPVSLLAVSKEYEETRRLEDNDDDSSAPSGLRDDCLLFYVSDLFRGKMSQ
uniref:Uncharacterized protein n=1 Tax=Salix viminalis TaxID=40686 RepID=A0A6N2KZ74_SALVM